VTLHTKPHQSKNVQKQKPEGRMQRGNRERRDHKYFDSKCGDENLETDDWQGRGRKMVVQVAFEGRNMASCGSMDECQCARSTEQNTLL
jgi:hypothetical protein